ncbi:sigma-54 interaction domain-containing protein [Evansella clarkii]|uniref:sigma-54 interaction domain-containing protein n=1 Tax=Evansella clarkii TaxID=79879 RepID=UPI001EEE9100|nr:sigma 54-interacting transcriptional regulator [Evansella clarkii]
MPREVETAYEMPASSDNYTLWLEALIDAVNDGLLVIDSEGVVRLINKEYTRITGVKREEIIGKRLTDVRPGALLPLTLKDEKYRSGIYRREGINEYVVDMAPIYLEGNIAGAVSVCKSVSEVNNLANELEKSKARVKQLEKTVGQLHQAKYMFEDIAGSGTGLKLVVKLAEKAALSDLNVLITGESGTGKELFAQAIHNASNRKNEPFVAVNCAAIPPALLESELFGYEDGAFTNSKKGGKVGLFELSHQGTLFLDEIGEMSFELQAKLLRVLQEGLIRKIGSLAERELDVRVIAATNKDLEGMVNKKKFRDDLYYRINTVHLKIPALRHRKEDIRAIIAKFLDKNQFKTQPVITEEALQLLQNYDWPGNIRELKNAIHYAVSMSETNEVSINDFPETIQHYKGSASTFEENETLQNIINFTEREVIKNTLSKTGHDVEGKKAAARQLGISLATLYNKITSLKINF